MTLRVGWVHADPGYVGGAERTMQEFRNASPCEVVDGTDADVVVVGNVHEPLRLNGQRVIHYHHDMTRYPVDADLHIFCSPMQRRHYGLDGELVPPALDLERLRQMRQAQELMGDKREGAVWLGMHPNHPGKGLDLAREWANGNGDLTVYGNGSPNGQVPYEDVARALAHHKTFVHLPRALEPFGRSVVEAWAVGCALVINQNVGARYWIEENPEGLETAAERFWEVVCVH